MQKLFIEMAKRHENKENFARVTNVVSSIAITRDTDAGIVS